jgi:hypothetical protein
MADTQREARALNVIATSGRAALRKATDPQDRRRLRQRVHELLADLEHEIIQTGADASLLDDLERERRRVWE